MMRQAVLFCVFSSTLAGWANSYSADATPISTRNDLPLYLGAGLPITMPADLPEMGTNTVVIATQIQSHANDAGSPQETLILDGESHRISLSYQRSISSRMAVQAELQLIRYSAGGLDSLIGNWHSLFDLPSGDRDLFASNQLRFEYKNDESTHQISDSTSGFSDLSVSLGYQLIKNSGVNVAAYIGANLPTGSSGLGFGSDRTDIFSYLAMGSANQARLGLGWHVNLGGVVIGDQALFGRTTESVAWFGSLGAHWQANERWRWSAQLDSHSALLTSQIVELNGAATQLALATEYRKTRSGARWQIYFTEDLTVNKTADFSVGLNWTKPI